MKDTAAGTAAAALTLAALTLTVLTGCSANFDSDNAFGARCADEERLNSPTLVLIAQAVPTATLIPCVRAIPVGWGRDKLAVSNGRAEFALHSDREGDRALVVSVTKSCDLRGASRVPSEQTGARRYELPTRVTRGYAGKRFYVFPGGCITYSFRLSGESRAQAVTEASDAIGFATRTAVREMVDRTSDGRLTLDPAPRRS